MLLLVWHYAAIFYILNAAISLAVVALSSYDPFQATVEGSMALTKPWQPKVWVMLGQAMAAEYFSVTILCSFIYISMKFL